ncbi:MAG TPA: hypothetical protein VE056_04065 [Pyrinomonadaceae bacterium]|nr:hypothetical protein [Pyrinomonadaceae bacterium]
MRVASIVILLGALAIVSNGQSSANSQKPSLVVLKFSWSKERLGWQRDPFSGPLEDFDEVRARMRNEKRIDDAKRGGNSAEVDKIKREARADEANMAQKHRNTTSRYVFIYKVTVNNGSDKTIKSVDWDYVFLDADTHNEINRQQFTSEEKIGSGKTGELRVIVNRSPTRTISADSLNKNEREGLSEQVVIIRIEYADGSVWQHP